MIAMLSHDPRFSPPATARGRSGPTHKHHSSWSSSRPALVPPLESSSSSSSTSSPTILTCHFLTGNNGPASLDSTELSAAQALLNLTPSSYLQQRPVFQDLRGAKEGTMPMLCRESSPLDSSARCGDPAIARHHDRDHAVTCRTPPPLLLPRTLRAVPPPLDVVTSDSLSTDESSDDDDDEDEEASFYANRRHCCYATTVYEGSASLALDTDEDFLSPLHCFMRRYCVEAFSATAADAIEPRHGGSHHNPNGRVVVGQVGIRCLHCKHRPSSERAERAVCFPSSLKNIYHSIETWQRRHSLVCQDIPDWVKREMTGLIQMSKSCAGGRRGYWEESAARVGLADTESGIRFVRRPGDVGPAPDEARIVSTEPRGHPVVEPEDRALVTDYLFLLLDQMETCKFTEEDRAGGRSKVKSCPVGFPGMQCKHCAGKAGFGRYFPANLGALTSANSDRNIFNHIQKCRRCPAEVKQDLLRLRDEYQRHKNRRGSRKVFFQRVWDRLHN